MHSLLTALSILTIIPIAFRSAPSSECIARSRFWYPIIGLLLGILLGAALYSLMSSGVSAAIAAFLLLSLWIAATGALHLDGFCDGCDALFAGASKEDRLRILKDPHLGAFGFVGGVLLLLGKFVCMEETIEHSSCQAPWLVGLIVTTSRCFMLIVAAGAKYPRDEGTGRILIDATRRWEAALYASIALAAMGCTQFLAGIDIPMSLYIAPLLFVLTLRWLFTRRFGGVTGDCLGAAVEANELLMLLLIAVVK